MPDLANKNIECQLSENFSWTTSHTFVDVCHKYWVGHIQTKIICLSKSQILLCLLYFYLTTWWEEGELREGQVTDKENTEERYSGIWVWWVEVSHLIFIPSSSSKCLTTGMEEPDHSRETVAILYCQIQRANSKYDCLCIAFECHQRKITAKEAPSNQVNEMTWPVDISQHLLLITTGLQCLHSGLRMRKLSWQSQGLCIEPTAGAPSHQGVINVSPVGSVYGSKDLGIKVGVTSNVPSK